MARPVTIADLHGATVVLSDDRGDQARYGVAYAGASMLVCSYVFAGRQPSPLALTPGRRYRFGAPAPEGWLDGEGTLTDLGDFDTVTLHVDQLRLEQRRGAYRETMAVDAHLDVGDGPARQGRTDNLSTGGFAARFDGPSVPDGANAVVELELPDGHLVLRCEKVGGDVSQRFTFVDIDRRERDRLARVVRDAELAKRRLRGVAG